MTRSWFLVVACLVLSSPPARSDPGREFFAVYSFEPGVLWPLHIVACNPDPISSATVTVATESGVVGGATVPPERCEIVLVSDQRKASATIQEQLAYRVSSDLPVLAQQFMNYETFSGRPSAVRLPDRRELGTRYLVLAAPGGSRDTQPSVVVVVAPESARVSVTVTAATVAGGIVPALAAGETYTTDLPAFGVLQLASAPNLDLTGSVVTSNVPVQVHGGAIAGFFPVLSATLDPTLEAMPPEATWGRRYVVPATYPTTLAPNLVRILARDDGTTLTTDPVQPGTPAAIDRGAFVDLITTSDFVIDATAPVLVGRVDGRDAGGLGDPALVLLVPEEQFFTSAVFSLPDTWAAVEQWVDIVSPAGATVVLDGEPVPAPSLVPVSTSGFVHASLRLTFGRTHSVSADRPLAVYASARQGAAGMSYAVDVGCQAAMPPEVSRARTPLWLARRGADVLFSWEDLGPAATRYDAYAGTIRTIWDHSGLACGIPGTAVPGGRREAILPVPSSGYFLVSAANCGGEGATGGDPARSDCPP